MDQLAKKQCTRLARRPRKISETTRSSVIQIHQDNYSPLKWSYIADMECIPSSGCTNIYPCCRAQRKCLCCRPCGLVYINTPGRTCLHELFIEYEQATAWVARFSFKLEANYHQPPFALDDSLVTRPELGGSRVTRPNLAVH